MGASIWKCALSDETHGVVTDSNNDVLTVGFFMGTVDFDPGPGTFNLTSAGSRDGYLAKFDSDGNFIWAKTIITGVSSCYAESIQIDNDGNLIIVGNLSGSNHDLDPGPAVQLASTNGFDDWFIQKLDNNGNLIWAHSFGSAASDGVLGVTITSNNEIYTAGYYAGTTDFDPGPGIQNQTPNTMGWEEAYIQKFDASGNFQWVKTIKGTQGTYCWGIATDNTNIFVTGSYQLSADLDPNAGVTNVTSNGGGDIFNLKLNSIGNLLWGISFGGLGNETSKDIEIDGAGNIITLGVSDGTFDINPTAGVLNVTSIGGLDVFVQKLNSSGGFVWGKRFGGSSNEYGEEMSLDFLGDIYITGMFQATADFDPGAGTANLTAVSDYDSYITKFNSSGIHNWVAGALGSGTEFAYSIAVSDAGEVYGVGRHNGTTDFDHTAGTYNLTANLNDGYLVKISQCEFEVIPNTPLLSNLSNECSVSMPVAPTASNCLGSYTGTPDISFPITTQGTTVVTWTYTNSLGLTSTQTQNVIIDDVSAPLADVVTLSDITSECSVSSLTAPTATDNCAGTITGTHNATLPITAQGITVVTWTYDDGNGNTSTQTQNVIIDDVTAPIADVVTLSDITSECSVTSLTAPTATDNCTGSITGTHNATLPITAQGSTVVTWTYDDGNGNTSTQNQNVVIDDATAPVANIGSLSDITSECSVTSLTAPTATDNCAGTITGTHNATLPITSQGTIVVTWTYDDGNGNTSTQTQNVVIDDATAPVANIGSLSDVTSECSVSSLTAPTATDNCAGTITGTHNASLPITAQGTTVVTWTYDDGNGNTFTQTQNVIIDDVTAPVGDVAILADINSECEVTPTAPAATDNCVGTLTGTPDVAFPITAAGTTTVTWTYDDGNGNTSTQMQDVIITPIDNGITQVDALTLSADATGYNYQWVDCDNGNQAISGATNQTFVATVNGNYAVEIDNGTCTVVSACIVIDEVGIKEIWDAELFEVYPNPTTGIVYIESTSKIESIELVDALGQVINVYSANENKIEIKTAPGVYFLRIMAEGSENIIRVVKQ